MVHELFHKTPLDEQFYLQHIQSRLPDKLIDFHVHMNLPEHVKAITPERIAMDWALEAGLIMTYEDSQHYLKTMLPDKEVDLLVFPWPLPEADIIANNDYLSKLALDKKVNALMTVDPKFSAEYCDDNLTNNGFMGFKPYPYFASQVKGAEVSIFDFMSKEHLAVLDKHEKILMLHLPRAGRLPDKDNIKELLEMRQEFPNVKIVLAHYGRCFNHNTLVESLDILGKDVEGFYFDTAAVINPKVYEVAFERISEDKMLFATDMPILWWHGKQTWQNPSPTIFARENFSWNTHPTKDEEDSYTYIIYQQLKNILDVIGNDDILKEKLFRTNAEFLLGKGE